MNKELIKRYIEYLNDALQHEDDPNEADILETKRDALMDILEGKNAYIAIEMLVYLLDWMDDYYNGNLEAMITHYSGDSSGKYYSKLVSIAARDGVDIQRSTYN